MIGLFFVITSGLAMFIVVRGAGMRLARHAPLRQDHANGVIHWKHQGCRACIRRRLLDDLPLEPPARKPLPPAPSQAALYEEVMGPLSDLIAAAERTAQAQWDHEKNPPPAPEPASGPALTGTGGSNTGHGGPNETGYAVPLSPAAGGMAADDIEALHAEHKILMREIEAMAWDPAVPSSNQRWDNLWGQVHAIEMQIIRAAKQD